MKKERQLKPEKKPYINLKKTQKVKIREKDKREYFVRVIIIKGALVKIKIIAVALLENDNLV